MTKLDLSQKCRVDLTEYPNIMDWKSQYCICQCYMNNPYRVK